MRIILAIGGAILATAILAWLGWGLYIVANIY